MEDIKVTCVRCGSLFYYHKMNTIDLMTNTNGEVWTVNFEPSLFIDNVTKTDESARMCVRCIKSLFSTDLVITALLIEKLSYNTP